MEPEPEQVQEQKPSFGERLDEGRQTWQPRLWSRLIVVGAVAIYMLLFIVLNTHRVKISFVFVSTRVPVVLAIVVALVLGIVLGTFSSQLHRYRTRRR
ncbi:MAG TPA: lipopolysaccharide assembly protein LapA domain-containing protein [Gaiellaceae bacterium]|nr:lipopolysaccharide assembly protein LapA domain-containing protein [Gaiellaceae bacterium]